VLVEGQPAGILTDRDLRGRVLAEGRGPDTPVAEVMTQPVLSLPAESSRFEVLVFMLEHGVHHAPLTKGGEVIGLLSDTDLLRLQVKSPLSVLRTLERLDQPRALQGYAPEVAGMVELLSWGGLEATQIGRVVSRLNDALVGRLLRRAEGELGPPPTPYAWIVFGSEGRLEQALLTDQDNALVYRDAGAEAERYFAALAERVVGDLIAAQFPPCRGGFMATHWRLPLDEWLRQFRGWVQAPQPRALIEAANFFDFRRVHGALELEPLQQVLAEAAHEQIFLAHLARAALGFAPPLGLFRHIRQEDGGVDLKKGGLIPIVSLARLHALECGSRARPPLERLEAAAAAGTLSRAGAATLAEAFRFLLRLRLRAQLQALRAGQPADNRVRLDELTSLERRHLKETFVALGEMQQATALRYAVERLG
jgi:CBS domain-containing protein